ncbi:unnamed protein product [Boreogadus saida]
MEADERSVFPAVVLASYGFYVILKGSVRPQDPNSRGPKKDPKGPFEDVPQDSPAVRRCVLTTKPPETLKVSHSVYAEGM